MGDSLQQAAPFRGRRSVRRARVDYRDLVAALRPENADPNSDTPTAAPARVWRQRKRGGPAAVTAAGPAAAAGAAETEATELYLKLTAAAPDEQQLAQLHQADSPQPAKRQHVIAAAAEAPQTQAAEKGQASEAVARESSGGTPMAGTLAQRQRKQRQRVVADARGGVGPSATAAAAAGKLGAIEPEGVENEYERQRSERIKRNELMLRQLGVADAAGGLAAAVVAGQRQQHPAAAGGDSRGEARQRPRERRPALSASAVPARASKRQRGERPVAPQVLAEAAAELGAGGVADVAGASDKDLEHGALLDLDAYFQLLGQDTSGAVQSDGRFRGWVNPAVCERYGIPQDSEAAWEAGGGGKFSFKIDKKAIPAALKGRGWSDARAFSHTQLVKNPNAYFYRHVAPHEQQAQGEWTEEEHRLFVKTARQHGVGDKWGLFASYLPQRVGYQCSAYYRDVIIPQGLVTDRRFRMTRGGKAVYVG